ncbi:alpha-1,2-mannosyltransferase [Rhodococcus triatomae]|uniref:Alpha-1,2-mannosyltransferase n=1 Tax=Rhodococcus triatomae TaxID=300028 RepID=A0A1G8DTS1_9NOCA|nr:glycosyltransferase 87 family protein [Rhodococcus triatomae]SDH61106.1 alpha-1,2-mannosyltransferase [Rhodococcus triatomae]
MVTVRPWTPDIGILRGGLDLFVYRDGAWMIQNGLPLYAGPVTLGLLYTYTPFSTLVFIPVEKIPGPWVAGSWLVFNLAVLLAAVVLCWRLLGYRTTPYLVLVSAAIALGSTFLEPVRTTLYYGQINLVLMALVLWDFSRPESSRYRGIAVGVAAGIKLTPVYFVTVFGALRQWRAVAVAVLTFAATVAISWAILPDDSRRYWTQTFFDSARIAPDAHPANQSMRGMVAHLSGGPGPVWLWLAVALPVFLASMAIVVASYRAGDRLLAVAFAGLTSAVVSPFSWSHHWVWFVPLLVHLVDRALRNPRWWAPIVAIFAATAAWPYRWSADSVVVGLFLFPPDWPVAPILQNIYLLVFAVIAVWIAVARWRAGSFRRTSRLPARASVGSLTGRTLGGRVRPGPAESGPLRDGGTPTEQEPGPSRPVG